MITITVTGEVPELIAAHLTWLADKFGGTNVITDVIEHKAKRTADKAISKAKEPAAPAPEAPSVPHPETVADVSPVTVSAVPTIKELMDLASAKSKIVGSERVKGVIGACGAKTIKELPADRLPELKLNLECLQ
jgi:hypothetical protein